jgi:DNA-binding CsgD family transcriptional regulator
MATAAGGARGPGGGPAAAPLVARDRELAAVSDAVTGARGSAAALILEGEPGIGKTSLWERGVSLGRQVGLRVLLSRASAAETGLPFAALIDLFDGVTAEELAGLPPPQLRALNVALYREEPTGGPPPAGVIALGLLSALRGLAAHGQLLVAVDDVQWLDRASEEALGYAARRLENTPVTFLLARRPGRRSELENALPDSRVDHVVVGPTSLGGTRQLLLARLGLRLPHHVLRRVFDVTLGNPLFALEVGRLLSTRDLDALGEDVPVPDDVDDLLGLRVADLDGPARRVLLALALDADLRLSQLDDVAGPSAVASAVASGVAVLDGERVRPAHPLLGAAAKRQSTEDERRQLHRALAATIADEQRQALHLALATAGQDEALAARVAAAADAAAARGATRLAVQLGTHALRLTPPVSATRVARLLGLGQQLAVAGEKQRLTDLLAGRVAELPAPASRVAGYLLLTAGVVHDNDDIRRLLERALADAAADPQLRAPVLAQLAENEAAITVTGISHARQRAEEALASGGQPESRRHALYALAWTRALGGEPVADVTAEYAALSPDHSYLARSPDRVAAQRHVWRGEVAQARELLASLQAQAEEWAEPSSFALARLHRCELELRVGAWDSAERLLDEWAASTDSRLLHWPMYERCRALLAAGRGAPDDARQWAGQALRLATATGVRWDWLEATRALGLAALLDGDPLLAGRHLSAVWEHTEREGVADPGAFPAAPDLVDALVAAGDLATARRVAARLAEQARQQDHPWALAGSRRSTAVVALANRFADDSAGALDRAAAEYRELGLAFDEARTLLALGQARRRARKWGGARDALDRAATGFQAIGSPGWAETARAELARVGARRPAPPGDLTDTERRVARLAAQGLSNKEIARSLVVTVSTVEFHLRNAYAKLGIRSRVQLAGVGLEAPEDPQR